MAFIEAEDDTAYIQHTIPIPNTSIGRAWRRDFIVVSHGLSTLAAPLEDERQRLSLERMFVEFTQAVDAIQASAEVVSDIEWSGRALGYGPGAEPSTHLAGRGYCYALPPYPVWLSWFGSEYAPLVRDHLSVESAKVIDDRLLHRLPNTSADRDTLLASMAKPPATQPKNRRRWFGLSRYIASVEAPPSWLPLEYLAFPGDAGPEVFGLPDVAPTIPPSLSNQTAVDPQPSACKPDGERALPRLLQYRHARGRTVVRLTRPT